MAKDNPKVLITPQNIQRRQFFKKSSYALTLTASLLYFPKLLWAQTLGVVATVKQKIANVKRTQTVDDSITSIDYTTKYNNFYELGMGKYDPHMNAKALTIDPWSIQVAGLCKNKGEYSLQQILDEVELEERVYRFRCVEAWSAVIPWTGFTLSQLIDKLQPTKEAKYIAFESIYDKKNPLPGQRRFKSSIRWPYREGLRLDEAMHPLTLLVVGMYGKPLPAQNGAPMRLIVPWKYGFKSIKSIVKMTFTDTQPATTWNMQAPREYGFYSNVNPFVSHPRWSQAKERRLGQWLGKKPTLMFNGYEKEVAHLYKNMDLTKNY